MSPQFWIGAQIFLDLLMVALLVWFLKVFYRRDSSFREHEQAVTRAESILKEMREIGQVLDANLKEKKELSSRILAQLDQALRVADESYDKISAILPEISRVSTTTHTESIDPEKTRSSVYALLGKGLQKEEIARHLGISLGEIELMIKLWPPKDTQ